MYIRRHAEKTITTLSKMFGAVLVAGPRQVGKTTMLNHITDGFNHATLDDPIARATAEERSGTFFLDNPPPVFIDEIQKTPALFEQIKLYLDRSGKKGQFYLCGSQQLKMMKGVSESLAGRIGIVTLLGFSMRERQGVTFDRPFIPTEEYFTAHKAEKADIKYANIWNMIHRGGMPELANNSDYDWRLFYSAYVNTYIERDVKELSNISDTVKFTNFMIATAACIGQLLNLTSLARAVGVSVPTAEKWLSILVASNVVYLLQPYHNNILKRIVKTPKLYFFDTGLAAYLAKWLTPEVLKNGAMAGAFFENFVLLEIVKSYYNQGIIEPPLYFYRDKDMNEIDLLIEDGGTLYPIEIKKHADPHKKDISTFQKLDNIPNMKRGTGGIICLYDKLISLSKTDKVIPINYI